MSEEATVSLYLDLQPDRAADIEVVARAALAFSAAIKALADELAPETDVRVELVSGTEGSLSLNSVIRGAGMFAAKARLKEIAIGIAIYFAMEVRDYGVQGIMDHLSGKDTPQAVKLSDDDVKRIAKAVQSEAVQKQVRQLYKEVERDPAIRGVGATERAGERPANVVPRSAFQARAGVTVREQTVAHRTVPERITVILVSPVLVEGSRRWKFRGPTGEFGAPVKDAEFISRVLSGTTAVPMVAGILMDVEVETYEEMKDGVWVQQGRAVTRVFGLKPPLRPQERPLFPAEGEQQDDDDD